MSKGSAVFAILVAFVGGVIVGHLATGGSGGGEEAAIAADDGAAAGGPANPAAGDVERFRVPVTADQPVEGPADALVTIVTFSDFQCPFCSRVNPTLERLMKEYAGKVRIVWRNEPLGFHENAKPAAELGLEAFAQGGNEKFWQAHKLLFENQRALTRPDLDRYAQQLQLNMDKYRQAMDSHKHMAKIDADSALAARIGQTGTPGFFINGRPLKGAQPFEKFQEIVVDEIKRAEALVKAGTPKARVYAELTKGGKSEAGAAGAPPAGDAPPARRQPDPAAVYKVPVGNSPSRGPADALVTVVQFSDFQCPFCTRVEPTVTQIVETYGNDVRIVWKDNPLPFHDNAIPAAIAAREAFVQGGAAKFWAMHKVLFENQRALGADDLKKYAQQLGLNMGRFTAALEQKTHEAVVKADQDLARSLGASGTPSFFINGVNLRGAQPFERFKAVIDEQLAKARAKVAAGTPKARVYEELTKDGATEAQFLAAPAGAPAAPPAEPGEDPNKVYNIALPANAPSFGPANAKVVIQEFSEFQCPFCARVNPTVEQIKREYGSRVRIVWRDYPLPFHDNAKPAAEAAREAFAQGGNEKFWAMHKILFENQRALTRPDLEKYAEQVGLNMTRFRQALDQHTHQAAVEADVAAVERAGARIGTPSFFINGKLLQGAQPFEAFKTAIDAALAAAR